VLLKTHVNDEFTHVHVVAAAFVPYTEAEPPFTPPHA
jgi:hypothetical protein